MSKKGGRGDTRLVTQFKIWDLLRERGPMSPRQVRVALGLDEHDANLLRNSLRRMRAKGSIVASGYTDKRVLQAGAKEPFIRQRRRNTPEQAMGLAKGRIMGLQAISRKRWGKEFMPRPRHALEQAMGWF